MKGRLTIKVLREEDGLQLGTLRINTLSELQETMEAVKSHIPVRFQVYEKDYMVSELREIKTVMKEQRVPFRCVDKSLIEVRTGKIMFGAMGYTIDFFGVQKYFLHGQEMQLLNYMELV